jgi:hypothetical protein
MKTLGNWTRRLSAVEVSLLCVALNRYIGEGPEANTKSLPFFTRLAACEALTSAMPHLVERGQRICQNMLEQIVNMEEASGENASSN